MLPGLQTASRSPCKATAVGLDSFKATQSCSRLLPRRPSSGSHARLLTPPAAAAKLRAAGPPATMELPAIVAFDLDATLWYPEMYMLSGPPFRLGSRRGRPVVVDAAGEEVGLIGDAWRILAELATDPKWESVQIAYVSRTDEPKWAKQCLQMLKLDNGTSLYDLADHHEIYPGSKRTHFRRIHDRSGIAYRDMLFFDDMHWNIEDCDELGVCGVYAPRGLTAEVWNKGLAEYAKRKQGSKR